MSHTVAGKQVGPISFGMMGLTARARQTPPDEAVKVMKAALENGANFWNGGDFYGPPDSNSLHILKKYFTEYPEDKEKVVISIKGALDMKNLRPDCSPEGIKKSIDTCLGVLEDKAFIDIFEPARVDPRVPIETTIDAIAEYVKAGKIGGIGLSECSAETVRRAHKRHPLAGVEVELSLFSTDPLDNGIAATCKELGIPLIGYAPLSHGFLTGAYRSYDDIPADDMKKHLPRFQPDVFDENLRLVDEVKAVAERKGCTVSQAAISWVASRSERGGLPVVIPVPGATSVARVNENLKVVTLSEEELRHIDDALARIPIKGSKWNPEVESLSER